MRAIPELRGAQVVIDAALPDTTRGQGHGGGDSQNGLLAGLSVEFRATAQRYVGGQRIITAALLNGAGLVDDPEYPGSAVELRAAQGRRRPLWL